MFQLKKKFLKKNLDVCQLQACPMQVIIKKMQNSQNKQKKESITHLYGVSRPQLMDEIRAIDSLLFLFSFTAAKKRYKTTKTRKKGERKQTNSALFSFLHISIDNKRMCNSFFDYSSFLFSFFFPDISIPFAVR